MKPPVNVNKGNLSRKNPLLCRLFNHKIYYHTSLSCQRNDKCTHSLPRHLPLKSLADKYQVSENTALK